MSGCNCRRIVHEDGCPDRPEPSVPALEGEAATLSQEAVTLAFHEMEMPPLRNAHAGVLAYDMVLPQWPEPEGGYWTPFRNRLPGNSRREIEERDRREWIEGVKRRLGIRCIGDEQWLPVPEWPVLDYVPPGSKWTVVSDQAMASYDGVHWLVKPEGMTSAEFFASLPLTGP